MQANLILTENRSEKCFMKKSQKPARTQHCCISAIMYIREDCPGQEKSIVNKVKIFYRIRLSGSRERKRKVFLFPATTTGIVGENMATPTLLINNAGSIL